MRIAVDLLGGDHAPDVVVDGALRAFQADPALHLLLVGPAQVADAVLRALTPDDRRRVTTDSDSADTGVHAAVRAVAAGRADAVVSAGSTAATVVAASLGFGRWPGVRQPALAAVLPTATGRVTLVDVGACVDPEPADLARHAVLGAGYVAALGRPEARVGLLTIGTEPGKGDRLRRAAAPLMTAVTLPAGSRYVGLVEGHEIVGGARADVVVTDGFTGNVLLKGVEAAHARGAGRDVEGGGHAAEPERAAVLLGVAGTVVVCHGAATAVDVASGIGLAGRLHRRGVMTALAELLDALAGPAGRGGRA